ncbi:unnamed protein product [Mytilus coruscus]|uniref:Uncharacterized protein n=1 Tax=Mytilus coruscus TaxID=42192 RepID=A0A6J8C940_MYTCO|nr:unnamed protein product [Mytilus coruscus]
MIKIILLSVLGMIVCQPSLPGGWHKFGGHLGVNILLACKSKLEAENFAVHDVIPMDPILEQVVAGYNYRFNATVEHVNHKKTLHRKHYTENTTQKTLHRKHYTENTTQKTLHRKHYTENTTQKTLHRKHYTENTTQKTLHRKLKIDKKKPQRITVKISYRLAFRRSFSDNFYCDAATLSSLLPGEDPLVCLYGCSGNIITSMSYYCTDYSVDEDWSSGERTVVYTFPATTSNIYHFGYISSAWIDLVEGGNNWSMRTAANLTVRSDIGKINSSPKSAMKPITRMKYGCQYSVQIPVQDDDGDKVKCRWSTKTRSPVFYNATGRTGWYAVAVQLEDFALSSNMMPLSSVPLQFLVQVFKSSGYCKDRPVLIKTNFIDGTNFNISLYSTLCEIMVAKSATNTSRYTLAIRQHYV